MYDKAGVLINLLKKESFLPQPAGSWEVGYVDVMTEGLPKESSLVRLYYPTQQKHEVLPERCPIWTEQDTKDGFINFMHSMVKRWPSWVNNKEFAGLGLIQNIPSFVTNTAFTPIVSMIWGALGKNCKIPIINQAQMATAPSGNWPLVVFSHGMGCNRYAYSKICYDLASEGFIVAAVEHREGSACNSTFSVDGVLKEVPHYFLSTHDHEYEVRNKQINHRAHEVKMATDLIFRLNAGQFVENVKINDAHFNLNIFKGKINQGECFLMGHSFGGATAILQASKDDRFKGVVAMDPWMFPASEENFSVSKPVLMINTQHFVHKNSIAKVREVCDDLSALLLEGAVHLVHTDTPLLFDYSPSCMLVKNILGMVCSRPAEEVLADNHAILHCWIQSMIDGKSMEKREEWGCDVV